MLQLRAHIDLAKLMLLHVLWLFAFIALAPREEKEEKKMKRTYTFHFLSCPTLRALVGVARLDPVSNLADVLHFSSLGSGL